ncbi:alpha/beta hydrolase [Sphingomonas sp.]|uniref:alpha/beta hydrolase n=1 Tax=Sphingomonas sp. TaxID=28214 RepID=UPI0025E76660|nr:alpha/beta hydrolase [Sphingomonas sp.]
MRFSHAIMFCALVASGCQAAPHKAKDCQGSECSVPSEAAKPVMLTASDGVKVHGSLYEAAKPKALILLFHQAGSSKDEYATIAPRLRDAGYSALAIDQRSGGGLFGTNETAKGLGREADYLEARPDLKAALDWARQQKLPIVLWGSSYSSSLIFPLAAGDPDGVIALLSFSPGEYFDDKHMIRAAAAKISVPVFIASTNSPDEVSEADPILAALPKNAANVRYIPEHGVHGSSTLIAKRNPEGAEDGWRAVLAFLGNVTPTK